MHFYGAPKRSKLIPLTHYCIDFSGCFIIILHGIFCQRIVCQGAGLSSQERVYPRLRSPYVSSLGSDLRLGIPRTHGRISARSGYLLVRRQNLRNIAEFSVGCTVLRSR